LLVVLILDAGACPAVGEHEVVAIGHREALGVRQVVFHLPLQERELFPVCPFGLMPAGTESDDDVVLDEQKQVEDLLLHGATNENPTDGSTCVKELVQRYLTLHPHE
jgi:hypothetical protein